jgi:hypothetical protein
MNGNDGPPFNPPTLSELSIRADKPAPLTRAPELPPIPGSLAHSSARGETIRVEGTNVVRVPFGVRQPRRHRPARPDTWVTLVLPFQAGGPTPPQAA